MNKTAAALVVLGGILSILFLAFLGGVEIRESHLESTCISNGMTPLWQASSPTDNRPDGMLPFHCVNKEN